MRLGLGLSIASTILGSGEDEDVFDPATLSLDGWWRASFTASATQDPVASAGTSGDNGTLASIPGVGTTVNGYAPISLNGTTQFVVTSTADMSDLYTVSAMTAIVLFNATGAASAATDFYDDASLAGDDGGNLGLVINADGVRAGIYDSQARQTSVLTYTANTWAMAAMRFIGGGTKLVKCRLNSTDATPVSSGGNISGLGNNPVWGKNYAAAKFVAAQYLEIMCSKTVLADADLDDIKSYFNSRYALSL